MKLVTEPTYKPGSVVSSHSSRPCVTARLEQPTRTRRGSRHKVPIWSCSRWGLPCRSVTRLAVRSYRTISPLPRILKNRSAVSFCCTVRRLAPPRRYLAPYPVEPGLSSAPTRDDATARPTPPPAIVLGQTNRLHRATTGFSAKRRQCALSPSSARIRSDSRAAVYNSLRGAPLRSAANRAAVDGGRCALSAA